MVEKTNLASIFKTHYFFTFFFFKNLLLT